MAKRIELYTQPGCPPCKQAAEFLTDQGVDFVTYDVREDDAAMNRLVNDLKSRSTPTIVIDGEVLFGFDPERLQALLWA